jgi:hypothetical protein
MFVASKNESIKTSVTLLSLTRYRPRINCLPGTRDSLKVHNIARDFHDHKSPVRIHAHFHILLRTEIIGHKLGRIAQNKVVNTILRLEPLGRTLMPVRLDDASWMPAPVLPPTAFFWVSRLDDG